MNDTMANGLRKQGKSELSTINVHESAFNNEQTDDFMDKNEDDFSLAHELRHFFRMMGIFGLYYTPKSWQKRSCTSNWNLFLYKMHQTYCFLIQLILWLNCIRIIVGFWVGDEASLQYKFIALKITFSIWNFQSAVNATIWYCLCATDKLPNIIDMWQTYCQSSYSSQLFGTSLPAKCVRKSIRVVLAIASCIIFMNMATPIFSMVGPIESLRNDSRFILTPFSIEDDLWVATLIPVFIFSNAAFVYPLALFVVICVIITYQYQELSKYFNASIGKDGKFSKCLIGLRRQHQYLSKIVFLMDDAFSFYLAVTVAANITLACFSLYTLLIADALTNFLAKCLMSFWVVGVCINFAILGCFAAQVNEKVKVTYYCLFN
ncbi:uncharacterized protein [Amphiura filiformis]|uniref:uncharacterized protein n=1 Tax=Amphiura filiformis TaxID=82378 RepID=UPI003B224C63